MKTKKTMILINAIFFFIVAVLISLISGVILKILLTNCCIYDCKYCINRRTNNVKRAIFTSEEVCELTINFYKRYFKDVVLPSHTTDVDASVWFQALNPNILLRMQLVEQ